MQTESIWESAEELIGLTRLAWSKLKDKKELKNGDGESSVHGTAFSLAQAWDLLASPHVKRISIGGGHPLDDTQIRKKKKCRSTNAALLGAAAEISFIDRMIDVIAGRIKMAALIRICRDSFTKTRLANTNPGRMAVYLIRN
ncbi:uncharacterized [Tachysurus ichikawai]